MLTTVTVYWDRKEMFEGWRDALHLSSNGMDGVSSLVFLHDLWADHIPENASIGQYHNEYSKNPCSKCSEWMMKLDVDCIVPPLFFKKLLPILETAKPREWFNVGMFYLNQTGSKMLADGAAHSDIIARRNTLTQRKELGGTNFVCRVQDYLDAGGCDERFRGWGWEDYYQIFGLDRQYKGEYPIQSPAVPTIENVTKLCRDYIARPKATELFVRDIDLCLLHRWHPDSTDPEYKKYSHANKQILLERVRSAYPLLTAHV